MIVAVGEDLALPDEGEGSPLAPVGGAPSLGGENGAGLLFPLPGGGHLEEAEDLENSVDPEDYPEDIPDVGNPSSGPSDAEIIQGGSSCEVLVSDFGELERFRKKEFFQIVTVFPELCKWGPSCATILREQFPHCDYDCATCTLHGSNGEGANEEVEAVEVDQVVGQVGGWACFKFVENMGINTLISSVFLSSTRLQRGPLLTVLKHTLREPDY